MEAIFQYICAECYYVKGIDLIVVIASKVREGLMKKEGQAIKKGSKSANSEKMCEGVYAAALTPMHKDYSCNYEELAKHCQDLMKRGCKGVALFGTTGEGPSFSVDERKQAVKAVINLGVDPRKIIVGVSCAAMEDVVKITSAAIDLQCSSVLMMPPFFYKNVDEAGVIAFYKEVIKRVGNPKLKVILYHIPQMSGVPITLNIIKTLVEEFPDIVVGMKDSEGNLGLCKEIIAACPSFKVMAGNESQISEIVNFGGVGGITGLANAFPELISSLYELGKDKQKPNHSKAINEIRQSIKLYATFPAIKAIVAFQKGAAWDVLRPPLSRLGKQQSKSLIDALKAQQLL